MSREKIRENELYGVPSIDGNLVREALRDNVVYGLKVDGGGEIEIYYPDMFNVVLNCADDKKLFLGFDVLNIGATNKLYYSTGNVSSQGASIEPETRFDTTNTNSWISFGAIENFAENETWKAVFGKGSMSFWFTNKGEEQGCVFIGKSLVVNEDGQTVSPKNVANKVIEFNIPELIIK